MWTKQQCLTVSALIKAKHFTHKNDKLYHIKPFRTLNPATRWMSEIRCIILFCCFYAADLVWLCWVHSCTLFGLLINQQVHVVVRQSRNQSNPHVSLCEALRYRVICNFYVKIYIFLLLNIFPSHVTLN